MSESKTPSKSVAATIGALLVAGLGWLASQLGWIDLGESTEGGGTATAHASESAEIELPSTPASAQQDQGTETSDEDDSVHGVDRDTYELGLARIADGFENGLNDVLVECAGEVVHLLNDDTIPPRHQQFLVELENDITIKISHNVDQATRVPVEKGDWVSFFGEYEWNDKGGVVHWTHRAHGGDHPDGWIRHEGDIYW